MWECGNVYIANCLRYTNERRKERNSKKSRKEYLKLQNLPFSHQLHHPQSIVQFPQIVGILSMKTRILKKCIFL